MSLTVLASQILEAAKLIDQELATSSKIDEARPIKSSFIIKLSKFSRSLAPKFRSYLLRVFSRLRSLRSSDIEKGKPINTPISDSDENREICELSFERYNELPENLGSVKELLINKCHQIRTLIEEPGPALFNIFTNWTELVSLEAVCHFRLFNAIPPVGSASYAEIATATQIPQDLVFRFIRNCIVNGIFHEPIPGHIQHTPRSRWLTTRGQGLLDLIALNYYELAPAGLRYIDTIEKYGLAEEPHQAPFALNNNDLPIFEVLARDEKRRLRFSCSMQYLASDKGYNVEFIQNGFDWASVDVPGARMLDVGGGLGYISAHIAGYTKNLHFVVQDLPAVVADAIQKKSNLADSHITDRISFLPLSFFTSHSPSTQAFDIIFVRWIIHNWSDKYTRQIFRAMFPALRKGCELFIVEYLLDEKSPGINITNNVGQRVDMIMGAAFSAKERTISGLKSLMNEVAQELGGVWRDWTIKKPKGSFVSFIRVVWDDSMSKK